MLSTEGDKVVECVLQEGKVFVTTMNRTSDPLVYTAEDLSGSFTGHLIYEDASLLAWSYDIQVTKPMSGQIKGDLGAGSGARINPQTGQMQIIKIWNNQVRIQEKYNAISQDEFIKKFDAATGGVATPETVATCRN